MCWPNHTTHAGKRTLVLMYIYMYVSPENKKLHGVKLVSIALALQKEWKMVGFPPGACGGMATAHKKWEIIPARFCT